MTDCMKEEDTKDISENISIITPEIIIASTSKIEDVNINFTKSSMNNQLKFETKSPLGHRVVLKESTWTQHVIKDHPDRFFYEIESNFSQIVGVLSEPTIIADDKDFSPENVRLNYLGNVLINNNGKLTLKDVKIVTEVTTDVKVDFKNPSTWTYQEMVTCIVQTKNKEDFSDRRLHYVRNYV